MNHRGLDQWRAQNPERWPLAPSAVVPPAPLIPPEIPNHQLLRCIGQGSYGEVWLARSNTGVYRAVKIVHRSRFDSDRPYQREFDGLKRYEPISRADPSQVHILSIGQTEDYFYYLMELADDGNSHTNSAEPGDDWSANYVSKTLKLELLRRGRLPVDECISLGLSLTRALTHLHQKGLIHRDIKPSNIIFVHGQPKLADIGLVANRDATCSFVGTEGYLPPEGPGNPQADLFSLGKVLYEACTGNDRHDFPVLPIHKPHQPQAPGAQDPAPSSSRTRLSADKEKALLEFNAILVKACTPDTRQRYQTAHEMHQDLLLLLAGKSVRRAHLIERRLAVMTRMGIMSLIALFIFAVPFFMAIREARRATELTKKAQAETAKLREVLELLRNMLKGVGPSVALGRDTMLLREILDQSAQRIGSDLLHNPEAELELRAVLADVYEELGLYNHECNIAARGLEIGLERLGPKHPSIAEMQRQLGAAAAGLNQNTEAEWRFRQALAAQFTLYGTENLEIARSLDALGRQLAQCGKRREAEGLLRAALAMRIEHYGNEHPEVSESLSHLANSVDDRVPEAEILYREALRMQRDLQPPGHPDHPDIVETLNRLGCILRNQKQYAESEKLHREAVRMARNLWGPDHLKVSESVQGLALVLRDQNDLNTAEALLTEALQMRRQLFGDEPGKIGACVDNLMDVLLRQHKYEQARQLVTLLMRDNGSTALLRVRAELFARQRRWKEAIDDTRRIVVLNTNQYWPHFILATLLAAQQDFAGYREFCGVILNRFRTTSDPGAAEVLSKSCLLLPDSGVDLKHVAELADRAISFGRQNRLWPWFMLCKGLSQYRQGLFLQASNQMREVMEYNGAAGDENLDLEANLISAMAAYRLNEPEHAREHLAKALSLFRSRLPHLSDDDLGPEWYDLLIGQILLREAKSLILAETSESTEPAVLYQED